MKAKWIQGLHYCPHCTNKLMTRIIITHKKYGYNAEYIKFCEDCGQVKSVYTKGVASKQIK